MSDTVTLIAGVLLTSVGLLALLPYVLRMGWRHRTGDLAVDSGLTSVLAAVEKFAEAPAPLQDAPDEEVRLTTVGVEELEELMAQLFSVRMAVSDIAAEVMETQDALALEVEFEDGRQPSRGVGERVIDAA